MTTTIFARPKPAASNTSRRFASPNDTGSPALLATCTRAISKSSAKYGIPSWASTRPTVCPPLPKPITNTWSDLLMVSTNILCKSSDFISQLDLAKRPTSASLLPNTKGAIIIDSSTAAVAACSNSRETILIWLDIASITKPNSPPCAKYRAVFKLSATECLILNAMANTTNAFKISKIANSINTCRQPPIKACTSSFIPTVIKKKPSKMSRNGRMSSSTWKRYSVSESSMPATNAPNAIDKPSSSVR